MNFDRCGEDHVTRRRQTLFIRKCFQEAFGCLTDIGEGFFPRRSLGPAALQFRAPSAFNRFAHSVRPRLWVLHVRDEKGGITPGLPAKPTRGSLPTAVVDHLQPAER
jgi:hypothetical protein